MGILILNTTNTMKTNTALKVMALLTAAIFLGAVADLLLDIEVNQIVAEIACVIVGTIYGIAAQTLISDAEKGDDHE